VHQTVNSIPEADAEVFQLLLPLLHIPCGDVSLPQGHSRSLLRCLCSLVVSLSEAVNRSLGSASSKLPTQPPPAPTKRSVSATGESVGTTAAATSVVVPAAAVVTALRAAAAAPAGSRPHRCGCAAAHAMQLLVTTGARVPVLLATSASMEGVLEVLADTDTTMVAADLCPEGPYAADLAVQQANSTFKELAAATAMRKCVAFSLFTLEEPWTSEFDLGYIAQICSLQ
jgi:hypothetical protein